MTFETTIDEKQIVSACFKIKLSMTLLTSKKRNPLSSSSSSSSSSSLSFSYLALVNNYVTYTSKLSAITNQVRVCGKNGIKTRSRFDAMISL
jgi:hypothetical protein